MLESIWFMFSDAGAPRRSGAKGPTLPEAAPLVDVYPWIRPLLFRMDPERAHERTMRLLGRLDRFLPPGAWPAVPGEGPSHETKGGAGPAMRGSRLAQRLWGLPFWNPIGLAAGLDKDGCATRSLAAMGFGFLEVGTVTPRPQPGNPRPRLFRLRARRALINRMGFNSAGALAVARNLERRTRSVPVGVNLGPNRDTTPDDLVASLTRAAVPLAPFADYWVLNLSSPNTPGLRGYLEPARLAATLGEMRAALAAGGITGPLFLKVSPDSSDDDLVAIARIARDHAIAGIIATNTTVTRPGLDPAEGTEPGGLSGTPLGPRASSVLRILYRELRGELPLVGVGGLATARDVYDRILDGAQLVQIYTALIYEGPSLVHRLIAGLEELLARDGHRHLAEAVGRSA